MLAACSAAGDANADADVEEARAPKRDGVYVSLAPNVGYGIWAYHYATMTAPVAGVDEQSRPIVFDATLRGPLFEFDLAIGHGVGRGVALAGEVAWSIQPLEQEGRLGWTGISDSAAMRGGVRIDFWPSPDGAAHLQFGLSLAATGFGGSTEMVDSPDNVVDPNKVLGPLGTFGAEWDFVRLRVFFFGVRAKLHGGVLFDEHARAIPFGATAALSVGWF